MRCTRVHYHSVRGTCYHVGKVVEDTQTQTKILRALAKLRRRQLTGQERDLLEWSKHLADAVEDVENGEDVRTVAEELAGGLADYAKLERERESVEREPVEVFSRETAAQSPSPLMALSLLLAIEAEEREDVRHFRREHLGGGTLAGCLPRWIVVSDRSLGQRRLMVEIAVGGGEWYSTEWQDWVSTVPAGFGAFEELRELSVSLAADYSWQEVQAADFMLSGAAPLLPGTVTTGRLLPSRPAALTYITLECSPIATPRDVMAAYASARRQLLGPRHRPLSEKHLALVAFGADERAARPRPSWKMILAKWNGGHPEWSYTSSHLLARDWRVARERVLRPPVR